MDGPAPPLGADAGPTIRSGLPQDLSGCILSSRGRPDTDDALGWNLGRSRARALGSEPLPGPDGVFCSRALASGEGR